MEKKKDKEGKEINYVEGELVTRSNPLAPAGGKLEGFPERIGNVGKRATARSREKLLSSVEDLYDQAGKTWEAYARASQAELEHSKLPEYLRKESDRIDKELDVKHDEDMQELEAREKMLKLKVAQTNLLIEQGLADVQAKRDLLKGGGAKPESFEEKEESLIRKRDERLEAARARWEPRIENAKSGRDRGEEEEAYLRDKIAIRENHSREFNKLLGNR